MTILGYCEACQATIHAKEFNHVSYFFLEDRVTGPWLLILLAIVLTQLHGQSIPVRWFLLLLCPLHLPSGTRIISILCMTLIETCLQAPHDPSTNPKHILCMCPFQLRFLEVQHAWILCAGVHILSILSKFILYDTEVTEKDANAKTHHQDTTLGVYLHGIIAVGPWFEPLDEPVQPICVGMESPRQMFLLVRPWHPFGGRLGSDHGVRSFLNRTVNHVTCERLCSTYRDVSCLSDQLNICVFIW